jgi:hypothetical protein
MKIKSLFFQGDLFAYFKVLWSVEEQFDRVEYPVKEYFVQLPNAR